MHLRGTAPPRRHAACSASSLAAPMRLRRPARGLPAPRAELTANRPPAVLEQRAAAEQGGAPSACPFLSAMQPPEVRVPLWRRFQQLFKPDAFQAAVREAAGGAAVSRLPAQPGFMSFLFLSQPEHIKDAFSGEATGATRQADIPSFVKLMGEESLVLVQDPAHKHLRALLAPAFAPDAVSKYVPDIAALVSRHLADWQAAGEAGVKGYDSLKMLTFEFIVSITLGRAYSRLELEELSAHYRTWTSGFLAWPWKDWPLTPFGAAMRAREEMLQHFRAAIAEARGVLAAGSVPPGILGALVSAVDEQGNRLTDEQIAVNVLLLLLAGHDTSSTCLTQVMANLQEHPAVMQRLRDEQQQVVAKHGDALSAAAIKDMAYADAVIRETLRVDPVVAGLFRVSNKDQTIGGYAVAKDQLLMLPLKQIAASDERWAGATGELDPAAFNPDRMLTPEGMKTGAQLPFGYGMRYCLGAGLALAEMKVYLALLARGYSFEADTNTRWTQAVGRVPANGLPIVLRPLAAA